MSLRVLLKATRLSWREHRAVQLATLTILASTFTIVISFISFALNLSGILFRWGESVQMTAYLKDGLSERDIASVNESIKNISEFKEIQFVSKDEAKNEFSQQMSNYAPNLLVDAGMENPFPASFQLTFTEQKDVPTLSGIADQITKITGVEDVSYGEDWIQNYTSLVDTFKWSSFTVTLVLVLGSFFVVANSIRASIDRRRDEIEILKLVGASDSMIRAPFIFEGALMGGVAVSIGLGLSYGFYLWQVHVAGTSLAFMNLSSQMDFLDSIYFVGIATSGVFIGALGSYSCVFRIRSLIDSGREA